MSFLQLSVSNQAAALLTRLLAARTIAILVVPYPPGMNSWIRPSSHVKEEQNYPSNLIRIDVSFAPFLQQGQILADPSFPEDLLHLARTFAVMRNATPTVLRSNLSNTLLPSGPVACSLQKGTVPKLISSTERRPFNAIDLNLYFETIQRMYANTGCNLSKEVRNFKVR